MMPRAAAKALALQATVHALFSVVVALPLAWLARDLVGAHPGGVRALFTDGSVFALDRFFKGDLPLTTASSLVISAAVLLFLADVAITCRYFEHLRDPEVKVSRIRAFVRVALARIVVAVLIGSLAALFGLFTSLLAHRLGPGTSDKTRDLLSIAGYPLGLIVSLPLVLFRDLWLTDAPNAEPLSKRLRAILVALRSRFFPLSAHYLGRGAAAALLLACAVPFVRAPGSWFATLVLLLLSRALVALRVIVRGSFYVLTARALGHCVQGVDGAVAVR